MDMELMRELANSSPRRLAEALEARLQDPEYKAFLHSNDERVRAEHEELLRTQKRRA